MQQSKLNSTVLYCTVLSLSVCCVIFYRYTCTQLKDNFVLIPDHRLKFLQNIHCYSFDCVCFFVLFFLSCSVVLMCFSVFISLIWYFFCSFFSVFLFFSAFEKHSNYFVRTYNIYIYCILYIFRSFCRHAWIKLPYECHLVLIAYCAHKNNKNRCYRVRCE